MQKLVIAVHAALVGMCLTSEAPCQQREDVPCRSPALQDTGERDDAAGLLQVVHSTARGAPTPPPNCVASSDQGGALNMFVCQGCIWVPSKFYEDSVLRLPLTSGYIHDLEPYGGVHLWGQDVWWTTRSADGTEFYHFANFNATKTPTSDDPKYKKAGKLKCSKDPALQEDYAFIRTQDHSPYDLFLDQDTRDRAERGMVTKIQNCYNGLSFYVLEKIFEALLDGLAKDSEVQSKVDLAFSMLSLPLMFVPGLGVPAEGVIAKTLADDMGQRVVDWLSEAGNVQSLVGFVADRQHANINNALSYAQDQAKAALAIGKLLVDTYSTYTEPLTTQDALAKLTNQDLMFFNWKFDTSESAQSHCSNSSIASLVDDGYETLLKMAKIGYHKNQIGHIRYRSYYGVVPCDQSDAWCYCSWLTRDSEKTFHFEGQIPDNYYQMVINYTNQDKTVGKYNVKTRDVQLR